MSDLKDKITFVTGASRGVGRGIATELGAAGATVYVTGRSVSGKPTTDHLPGTVDETAHLVTQAGGQGIPLRCDHTLDTDVEAAFARVASDHGVLDVLVNNVWGGYEAFDGEAFGAPFWEQPLPDRWRGMFEAGVRAHFKASQLAAPLMVAHKRGLIANISAGDTTGSKYLGSLPYDVAKAAVDRMAVGMAFELREHNVAAVSLYPGFTRTERVFEETGGVGGSESPRYTGRSVVALATDPDLMTKSGGAYMVGALAQEYGFTDTDGTQPEPFVLPDEFLID
jgi:NAD(P)-dependent dehydrogenase (short-subunit alcohol dehydrogenase family)